MKKYLLLFFLFMPFSPVSYAVVTDKTLNTWSEQWETYGEITKSHLQRQYDESIVLFDRYRQKREGDHGYDVSKGFDPNETHIDTLFELKVPMLYGYAYQLIKRKFEGEEQIKRLTALKSLIYEADTFNTGNTPYFSLLAFKSLNILASYLMSQPDRRGDIWKFIIKDPIIYQYFKEISLDTISFNNYLALVKKRANELMLSSIEKDASTPLPTPQIENLTQWYYFIPYLGFEIYLYYPNGILPLETFWRAHHHEVGVSAIGDGNCSVHGSTINNTFNLLIHDLFHWGVWENRAKLNEFHYRNINIKFKSYLLSCITNPLTGSVDNFQDLAVYFFLLHENFYSDVELDHFIRSILNEEELKKLFFGLNPEEAISSENSLQSENFKRFIGNVRLNNTVKIFELSTKSIWFQKKLHGILNEEIYQSSALNVSNISVTEISGMDSERDEITAKFKYKMKLKASPIFYEVMPFLNGKSTISAIEDDQFNLKIRIEPTDGNTSFQEKDITILNYKYARKNYADDYYKFLGLSYPDVFRDLPKGVEAEPSIVGEGLDRLLVDFYERHKSKFM